MRQQASRTTKTSTSLFRGRAHAGLLFAVGCYWIRRRWSAWLADRGRGNSNTVRPDSGGPLAGHACICTIITVCVARRYFVIVERLHARTHTVTSTYAHVNVGKLAEQSTLYGAYGATVVLPLLMMMAVLLCTVCGCHAHDIIAPRMITVMVCYCATHERTCTHIGEDGRACKES